MSLFDSIFGAKPAYGTPPFAGPHPQTGGANMPTTPQTLPVKRGLSGFLDRALNPTNALGQFGQALVAGTDNGLGRAMGHMMQQRGQRDELMQKQQAAMQRKVEQVGDKIGILDPVTGEFQVTYDAPDKPSGYTAELMAAGIDPNSDEGKGLLRQKAMNSADPFVTMSNPQGSYFGPRSGLPGALGIAPPVPTAAAPAAPKAGDVVGGYQYMGGEPGDQNNWKPAGGAGSQGPATFSQRVVGAVTAQESGGRVGIEGPQTAWGKAGGLMQVLPSTAREMADKLGIPYRPDLMTSKDKRAGPYQTQIGTAYLQQGFDKTGNLRDALRYYHGGPSRKMWGPKTNRYADEVMARLAGGR